jgi:hypothetical protein
MNKCFILAGAIVLAAGGSVWLLGGRGDVASLGVDGRVGELRVAVLETACITEEVKKLCLDLQVKDEIAFCTTESKEALTCELAKEAVSKAQKRDLHVCKNAKGVTSVYEMAADAALKAGCQQAVSGAIMHESTNADSDLVQALSVKCGWPVEPMDWGCCPHCVAWTDGCPPCRALCKYADKWKGHEAECEERI